MKQRKNIKHSKKANNDINIKQIKRKLGRLAEKL